MRARGGKGGSISIQDMAQRAVMVGRQHEWNANADRT
jgi:hypothetical protein